MTSYDDVTWSDFCLTFRKSLFHQYLTCVRIWSNLDHFWGSYDHFRDFVLSMGFSTYSLPLSDKTAVTMAYLSIRPNILPSTPFKWKAEHIRVQISIYRLWYDMVWYVWYVFTNPEYIVWYPDVMTSDVMINWRHSIAQCSSIGYLTSYQRYDLESVC